MKIDISLKCKNCETEMDLRNKGPFLYWVCQKCYPKFPERTWPYPSCPVCSKEMAYNEYKTKYRYECPTCKKNFTPRYDNYFIIPESQTGTRIDVYNEPDVNGRIWYWWEETQDITHSYKGMLDGGPYIKKEVKSP